MKEWKDWIDKIDLNEFTPNTKRSCQHIHTGILEPGTSTPNTTSRRQTPTSKMPVNAVDGKKKVRPKSPIRTQYPKKPKPVHKKQNTDKIENFFKRPRDMRKKKKNRKGRKKEPIKKSSHQILILRIWPWNRPSLMKPYWWTPSKDETRRNVAMPS